MIESILKQSFVKRAQGVYVSDRIVYTDTGKIVSKVLGETELSIDSKWPFTLYRHMPFSRLYTELNEKTITFLSPMLWEDPFEGAFFNINKSHNVKCICFTYNGSIGEEWAWKSYRCDEQLVRIEIMFDKLVNTLSGISCQGGNAWTFYISVCDYSMDKSSIIKFIKNVKPSGITLSLTNYLNIMSLKRKAFSYEKEIRIFAVHNTIVYDNIKSFKNVDYKNFMTRVLLEPLAPFQDKPRNKYYSKLQDIHNAGIKKYIKSLKIIKTQQSHLYEIK